MIDPSGPGPTETRDRNLSPVIARIQDDGPALVEGGEGPDPWKRGIEAPPRVEALRIWEAGEAPAVQPAAARSPTPEVPVAQAPAAKPAADRLPAVAGSGRRLGWLLPGALAASSLIALGVAGVLHLAPGQAPPRGTVNAEESALRSQLAALHETIATLSERIESRSTEAESRQVEALGERLDRMSRQVADLARGDRFPADLDRRLEALAQGLDTTALRLERLSARRDSPPGAEPGDGDGEGDRVSASQAQGGAAQPGMAGPGVAELQSGSASTGVAKAETQTTASLDHAGPVADRSGSFGVKDRDVAPKDLGAGVEASAVGAAPPAGSPAAPVDGPEPPDPGRPGPERPMLASSPPDSSPPVALSPEGGAGPVFAQGAQAPPGLVREGQPPALEPAEPLLVEADAPGEETDGAAKLTSKGRGAQTRGAQSLRQRVATATKAQPKATAGPGDTPPRRPSPRVVDDLF